MLLHMLKVCLVLPMFISSVDQCFEPNKELILEVGINSVIKKTNKQKISRLC